MQTFFKSLTPKDFTGMMFNVDAQAQTYNRFKAFPELSKYEEFKYELETQNITVKRDDGPSYAATSNDIFRYICLVYDKKSPFQRIDDFNKMKVWAMRYCGIEPGRGGEFTKVIQLIMTCQYEGVNRMIVKLLQLLNNDKWSYLVFLREKFYNMQAKFMGDADMEKKDLDMMTDMEETMSKLKIEISNADQLIGDQLFKYYNVAENLPTPENIAEQITKGEDPYSREDDY